LRLTVYNDDDDNHNNNGILLMSYQHILLLSYQHILLLSYKINYTESYDPRHISSNCWSAKHWLALPASTTPQVPEIVSELPLWSGHWAGWKRGLQLAENYADFTGIRITEW